MLDVKREKENLRNKIWSLMEKRGLGDFPFPLKGRIPNFKGSDLAAEKVRSLEVWKKAKVIFSNPDHAQRKVRENALKDGKILIMASPKLKHGFLMVKPENVKGKEVFASTIKGAFQYGEKVDVKNMPKPDLIITGCVAVGRDGYRLGKGGGYGDKEIEIIKKKFGEIPVITTIHDIQFLDKVPVEEKDTKVDVAVTPTKIYFLK